MREQIAQQPVKRRASAVPPPHTDDVDDLVGDASYYETRIPTSARRYVDTRGNQVIQRGNQRLVIHEQPPPRYRQPRRFHWLFWLGVVLCIAVSGTWVVNSLGTWWLNEQNTLTYGMPRTYQTDAVVGHSDSSAHPSHFIALNYHGRIQVIEMPGGDMAHEKTYIGPTIFSPNPELVPVTVSFEDVNGDGKPDMLVHIQGQTITYLNNGSQFQSSR